MAIVDHEDVIPQLAEHLRPVFQAETEMIPLTCAEHTVAYHFVPRLEG